MDFGYFFTFELFFYFAFKLNIFSLFLFVSIQLDVIKDINEI